MTLAEFLLARIAEDESDLANARISESPEWWMPDMWSRDRALAECDAKRQIVGMCADDAELAMNYRTAVKASASEWYLLSLARDVLKTLALPYADHPDYLPEWKP